MSLDRFRDAVRFLTIIPVGASNDAPDSEWLVRSAQFFPLVGAIVGLVSAAALLLSSLVLGPVIAALMAVLASVLLTSGFHEDGLADTADGLGGGWTVEQRLTIMKDSRIGTYGTLALIFAVALRVAAVAEMPPWIGAAALIASGAGGRAVGLPIIGWMKYAGNTSAMKVAYAPSPLRAGEIGFATIVVLLALAPLAATSDTHAPIALIGGIACGIALAVAVTLWSRRSIGGYTGDVLGAIEQVFEVGFLLGVAAVIRSAM
ncbi:MULTISPECIES: adenosylcobinamide-GDP ribazoletransferase [unclassified Bradyrhizobium]